jgi:hypothetical protein
MLENTGVLHSSPLIQNFVLEIRFKSKGRKNNTKPQKKIKCHAPKSKPNHIIRTPY